MLRRALRSLSCLTLSSGMVLSGPWFGALASAAANIRLNVPAGEASLPVSPVATGETTPAPLLPGAGLPEQLPASPQSAELPGIQQAASASAEALQRIEPAQIPVQAVLPGASPASGENADARRDAAEDPASPARAGAAAVAAAEENFPAARDGAQAGPAAELEMGRYFDRSRERWEKAPVALELAPEILANLAPDQRQDAEYVLGRMRQVLFTWQSPEFHPPRSAFPADRGQIVSVGDLFRKPTGDQEVARIGAERRALTSEQLAQVREDATFSVASQDFPGQSHVWQLGGILQRGRGPSRESRRDDMAAAFDQIRFRVANRLAAPGDARHFSLRQGAENFATGAYDLLGQLVGFPEMQPKFSGTEIERHLQKVLAMKMKARIATWALYDPETLAKARPIVDAVEEQAAKAWAARQEAVRESIEADLKKEGLSGEEFAQALADRFNAARQETFYAPLGTSEGLEALHPGLGRMLVNRGRTLEILGRKGRELDRAAVEFAKETEAELRREHPVRSRVPAWLEPRVNRAAAAYRAQGLDQLHRAAIAELGAKGLTSEALALDTELMLATEQRWLANELASRRVPANEFKWSFRIWNPRNWTVRKVARKGPHGEISYYEVEAHRTLATSTAWPFWRLLNIPLRALSWTNNSLYHLLVTNLLNGPLGIKSLFYASPFRHSWQLNQETGKIERSPGLRQTMVSRVRVLWASRRAMLKEHAEKNNYGLLGKGFERFLLIFSADILRGFLLPVIVAVGQPVLTVVNATLALALAATSFIWTTAASVAQWALEATVFDFSGTRHPASFGAILQQFLGALALGGLAWAFHSVPGWLPVLAPWAPWLGMAALGAWSVWTAGFDTHSGRVLPWLGPVIRATSGTAVQIAGAVLGLVWHPLAAIGLALGGGLRWGLRRAYDWVVYQALLRPLAKVPGRESKSLFRRVAGPGLSSNYFFQVSPEVAAVALWAAMEAAEHARYQAETEDLLGQPAAAYEGFLKPFILATQALRAAISRDSLGHARIADEEKAQREALSRALGPNERLYRRLLTIQERSGIKMSAENLTATLRQGAVLAERFYSGLFAAQRWTPEQVKAFWAARKLEPGDWVGVAKSHLDAVFGPDFLVPFEETDPSLRIDVREPGLADYARGLASGITPEELERVRVELDRPAVGQAEPSTPYVGTDALLQGRHRG